MTNYIVRIRIDTRFCVVLSFLILPSLSTSAGQAKGLVIMKTEIVSLEK